jgi:1-deoxy-D-xylulose-5-phosphate reductoisomerase
MSTAAGQSVPRRRLIVLGSTGSIGVNALAVVDHLRCAGLYEFEVVGLAAGSNVERLLQQAAQFNVAHLAIAEAPEKEVRSLFSGPDAALRLIEAVARPGDLVLGAMVGAAGIPATLAAIDRGCDIALANKETLVAAGAIVMPRARLRGVNILPVDSEHSAVFQCMEGLKTWSPGGLKEDQASAPSSLQAFRTPSLPSAVRRIVITASGGPFRNASAAAIAAATVEQALNHPTWNMGRKITIDSATMMNKALEIIEAHWLFDLSPQKIEVVIHPQSLVHSFVEFVDGSVIAQLGPPDMRTPIQHALTWPQRLEGCSRRLDWTTLRQLDFAPVDHDRFPAVRLAYDVIERGGTAGAILNAANEVAVHAFLERRIGFGQISALVRAAVDAIPARPIETLEDVLNADRQARQWSEQRIQAEPSAAAVVPAASHG